MAYTWTAPVTNREDGTSTMTYSDMNRITQNIGYLQEQLYSSVTISPTSWSRNDILTKTFWQTMLGIITDMAESLGVTVRTMTNDMEYNNINNVEKMILDIYNTIGGVTFVTIVTENDEPLTDEYEDPLVMPIY